MTRLHLHIAQQILLLSVLFSPLLTHSQNSGIRLLVRGDDMGYSHSGNAALIKCYKEGIQRSIEVIVPSPWFPEAVEMLEDNPGVDVGIHLVVTSEWDNIKWRPLTDAKSLVDEDGYFFPMIWPNKNYPDKALLQKQWKIEDIEKEWRAQIELAKRKIPRLSHISGHMGCTNMSKEVEALAKKLAVEYDIDINPEQMGVKYVSYEGLRKTGQDKIRSFITMLERLKPGTTYLFVDHPGLDSPELQAIHHIGYENVAEDRQGVTDCWTSPEVKKKIEELKIELISYTDLVQPKTTAVPR